MTREMQEEWAIDRTPKETANNPILAATSLPPTLTSNDLSRWATAFAKHKSLDDLFPVIASCITSCRLEHAEFLFKVAIHHYREDFRTRNDPSLINMFLRTYFEQGGPKAIEKAIRWNRVLAEGLVKPDEVTIALLLREYARREDWKACNSTLQRMKILGIERKKVEETRILSQEHIASLRLNADYSGTGESGQSLRLFDASALVTAPPQMQTKVAVAGLPTARLVPSKYEGASSLRRLLAAIDADDSQDPWVLQEKFERSCLSIMSERVQRELADLRKLSPTANSKNLRGLTASWHQKLAFAIDTEIDDVLSQRTDRIERASMAAAALLAALPAEKLSLITIQLMASMRPEEDLPDATRLVTLAYELAKAVGRETFAEQIRKNEFLQHTDLHPRNLDRMFNSGKSMDLAMRQIYKKLEDNMEARRKGWIPQWTPTLQGEVGTFLVDIAIRNLFFKPLDSGSVVPAFSHEIYYRNQKRIGVVKMHDKLRNLISQETENMFIVPWYMPMLVRPKPWLTYKSGGYLTFQNLCVRMKDDPVHLTLLQEADRANRLEPILTGLDILGRTPWTINDKVLWIALDLWNQGVDVSTFERAPENKEYPFVKREAFQDQAAYSSYVRESIKHKKDTSTSHSIMCDTNYKLEIASGLVGRTFYFPHNVDFRGRAYPIPPHLNHIGSDLARGLLLFAEAKPLGKRGLRWLKIQLANMFGFDKHSFDARVELVDGHMDEIVDSADNPLTGKKWWQKADEPWQCLAACIELTAALKSPDPVFYETRFPVQQDGSCNGLQHYAALGGDVDGAGQVNLTPAEKPQDVYGAVAALVNKKIQQDAEGGIDIAAKLLGKITRKIVKQPVMTNVYGVTKYGARQQIEERLIEHKAVAEADRKAAKIYLANKVFDSLGALFANAKAIQDWLTRAATEISRSLPLQTAEKYGWKKDKTVDASTLIGGYWNPTQRKNEGADGSESTDRYPQVSVIWTSPLGFPVVQPYLKSKSVVLRTRMQSLSLRMPTEFDPVDGSKQTSGFPPNFIHSLDATHMFKTALACYEAKITFASVHDCFWTHPSEVDRMARILREQFVHLHSQPILQKLRDEFLQRYKGHVVPVIVNRADMTKTAVIDPEDVIISTSNSPWGDGKPRAAPNLRRWREINIPELPARGDFDLTQVLDSPYFFS